MRTAIVCRDDLDVLMIFPTVKLPIFDAQIRKMDLVVEVRQLVLVGPFPDLVIGPIGVAVVVLAVTITLMEPALVLTLELVIEHDPFDPRVTLGSRSQ